MALEMGESMSPGSDFWIGPPLDGLAQAVLEATGAAGLSLFLVEPASGELRPTASWGISPPAELAGPAPPRQARAPFPIALNLTSHPDPHLLGIPIQVQGSPVGALLLAHPSFEPKPSPQSLLSLLSGLIAALWENRALREELSSRDTQDRSLIKATLDAQESERERLCLEVHDGMTQSLASAYQYLQALEQAPLTRDEGARHLLSRANALLRQSIQEAREIINSLQPAILKDLGLAAALRQEVRRLQEELGWQVEFQADATPLPKEAEVGLYRIMREAIVNARRHAGTARLRVHLRLQKGQVMAEVQDWGVGFDPEAPSLKGKGTGLFSMSKRAELLGGQCRVLSRPGQGTTVRVDIPLQGGSHGTH